MPDEMKSTIPHRFTIPHRLRSFDPMSPSLTFRYSTTRNVLGFPRRLSSAVAVWILVFGGAVAAGQEKPRKGSADNGLGSSSAIISALNGEQGAFLQWSEERFKAYLARDQYGVFQAEATKS